MQLKLTTIIEATHPKGQSPNTGQQTSIESIDGTILVVAGPGSGKTKTRISRALNLILNYEVPPEKILLFTSTFTEKAARQLRDRLNSGLSQCGVSGADIHEMTIGTIHSVCLDIITRITMALYDYKSQAVVRTASNDIYPFKRELQMMSTGQAVLSAIYKDVPLPIQVPEFT